jgi:hypothetical protein
VKRRDESLIFPVKMNYCDYNYDFKNSTKLKQTRRNINEKLYRIFEFSLSLIISILLLLRADELETMCRKLIENLSRHFILPHSIILFYRLYSFPHSNSQQQSNSIEHKIYLFFFSKKKQSKFFLFVVLERDNKKHDKQIVFYILLRFICID